MKIRHPFRLAFAAAATAALLLAGCGGDDGEQPDGDATPPAGETGYPVTVGELTLTEQPARIVSLSPTVTEMLFAIGAGDQVVAVDEYSNYPPEAPVTELSGFAVQPEVVADYDPDLVVISSYAADVVPQFEELSIPVHHTPDDPATVEEVYAQIVDLGALTGNVEAATALVAQMSGDLAELAAAAPERDEPLTYYYELDDTYWTYTSASIVGSLFTMVGLENIADDPEAATIQLSTEAIFAADPDLIFLANTAYGVDTGVVAGRDGWDTLSAVQDGNIVELDSDVASRWGPRIVDLMEVVVDAVAQVP